LDANSSRTEKQMLARLLQVCVLQASMSHVLTCGAVATQCHVSLQPAAQDYRR